MSLQLFLLKVSEIYNMSTGSVFHSVGTSTSKAQPPCLYYLTPTAPILQPHFIHQNCSSSVTFIDEQFHFTVFELCCLKGEIVLSKCLTDSHVIWVLKLLIQHKGDDNITVSTAHFKTYRHMYISLPQVKSGVTFTNVLLWFWVTLSCLMTNFGLGTEYSNGYECLCSSNPYHRGALSP